MLSQSFLAQLKSGQQTKSEDALDINELDMADGDSTKFDKDKPDEYIRADGFNTGETDHGDFDNRNDAHPDGELSADFVKQLGKGGAYFEATPERGYYGRKLATLKSKEGANLAHDMVASGMAFATGDRESAQSEMAGVARRALGQESTQNKVFEDAAANKSTEKYDPFTGGEFKSSVYDSRGNFHQSIMRGTDDTKAAIGGAINWLGDLTGSESMVEAGKQYTLEHSTNSRLNKREVENYSAAHTIDKKMTYIVETLGEMAPGLIFDAIATVGTGGIGAGQALIRRAGMEAVKAGAKKGFIAGPLASGFIQSVGNMENQLESKGHEVNTLASAASGVAGAATNSLPFLAALPRIGKAAGLGDEIIEGIGKRFADIAQTTAITGAAEGSASAVQEVIDKVIENQVTGEETKLEDFTTVEFVDNAIRAVLGGGTAGGVGSSLGHAGQKVLKEYNVAAEEAAATAYNAGIEGFQHEKDKLAPEGNMPEPDIDPENLSEGDVVPNAEEDARNDQSVEGSKGSGLTAADIPNLSDELGNWDFVHSMATDDEGKQLPWVDFKAKVDEYNDGVKPQEAITNDILASYVADKLHGGQPTVVGKGNQDAYAKNLKRGLSSLRGITRDSGIVSEKHFDYLSRSESTFYGDLQALISKKDASEAELSAFVDEHRLYKVSQQARKDSFRADGRAMYVARFGASKDVGASAPTLASEFSATMQAVKHEDNPLEHKSVDGDTKVDPAIADEAQADKAKQLKGKVAKVEARAAKVETLFDRLKAVAQGKRSDTDGAVAASDKEVRYAKTTRTDLARLLRSKTFGAAITIAKAYGIGDLESSSLANFKTEVRAQILEQGVENFTTGLKDNNTPKVTELGQNKGKRKTLSLGRRTDDGARSTAKGDATVTRTGDTGAKPLPNNKPIKQSDQAIKVERTVTEEGIANFEADIKDLEDAKTTAHRKSATRTSAKKAKKPLNKAIMSVKEKRKGALRALKVIRAKAKKATVKAAQTMRADGSARIQKQFQRNLATLRAGKLEGDKISSQVLRLVDEQIKTHTFTPETFEIVNEAATLIESRTSQSGKVSNRTYTDEDGSSTESPENDTQVDNGDIDVPLSEALIHDRARRVTATKSLFKLLRDSDDFKDIDLDVFEAKLLEPTELEAALGDLPDKDVGKPSLEVTFNSEDSLRRGSVLKLVSPKVKANLIKAAKEGDVERFSKVLNNSKIVEDTMPVGLDAGSSSSARILGMINRGYGLPEDKRVGISIKFPDGQERFAFIDPKEVTSFGAAEMDGFDLSVRHTDDKNFMRNLGRAFHAGLSRLQEGSTHGFEFTPQLSNFDSNTIVYGTDVGKGYTLREVTQKMKNSDGFDNQRRLPLSEFEVEQIFDVHAELIYDEIESMESSIKMVNQHNVQRKEGDTPQDRKNRAKQLKTALRLESKERAHVLAALVELKAKYDSIPIGDFDARGLIGGEIRSLILNNTEGEFRSRSIRDKKSSEVSDPEAHLLTRGEADAESHVEEGTRRERLTRGKEGKPTADNAKEVNTDYDKQDNAAFNTRLELLTDIPIFEVPEAEVDHKRPKGTTKNVTQEKRVTKDSSIEFKGTFYEARIAELEAQIERVKRPISAEKPMSSKHKALVVQLDALKTEARNRRSWGVNIEVSPKVDNEGSTISRQIHRADTSITALNLRARNADTPDAKAKAESSIASWESRKLKLEQELRDGREYSSSSKPERKQSGTKTVVQGNRATVDRDNRPIREAAAPVTPAQEKRIVSLAKRTPPSRVFKTIHKIVSSMRTQLEGMNYTLAEALYTRSGKGNADGSFERDRRLWANELRIGMADLLPDNPKIVQRAFEDAQNVAPKTHYGQKLKDFVDRHHAKIKEANPNYEGTGLPIALDTMAIEADRKGFKAILRKYKVEDIDTFMTDTFNGRGLSDFSINYGAGRPKGIRRKNKELAKAYQELSDAGFVDSDAPSVMNRFIESSTSYATWSRIFGANDHKGQFVENAFFDHLLDQTHPSERGDVLKMVEAVTHTMEPAPHWLNVFNSTAFAFHAATILWFSGIASLPEAASIAARARGDVDGLGKDLRGVFSKTKRAEAAKLVSEFETFTSGMQRHALHKLYGDGDLTAGKTSQWVSEKVFDLNGQSLLMEGMYHFATQTGHRFVTEHAKGAVKGNALSIRSLKELGVNVADAKTYLEHMESSKVALPKSAKKAVQLFVDESISNPHVSQLPTWMSDPRFQVLATLKKFFYAFWENNHRQIYSETKARGLNANALMPLAMALTFALPLAAVSEYLRELIKYPFGRGKGQDKTLGDRFTDTLLATGGLGPLQSAQSAYEQSSYGRNFAVSAAGPTPSLAFDLLRGEAKVSRAVPLLGQHPASRRAIDDGVRELLK